MSIILCKECMKKNKKSLGSVVYLPKGRFHWNVDEIIELRKKGLTVQQIALKYNKSIRRIWQIINGKYKTIKIFKKLKRS